MSVFKRVILSVLVALVFVPSAHARTPTQAEIDNARKYGIWWLMVNQFGDGHWRSASGMEVPATAEALEALRNAGVKSYPYTAGVSWLSNADAYSVDSMARKSIALYYAKVKVTPNLNRLVTWRNGSTAWGAYDHFDTSFPDTPMALGAIRTNGYKYSDGSPAYSDADLQTALYCNILPAQNTGIDQAVSGSWSYINPGTAAPAAAVASGILPTTANILEIYGIKMAKNWSSGSCGTGPSLSLQTAIDNGISWLMQKKNQDGGFGNNGTSTVLETVLVYQALNTIHPSGYDSVTSAAFGYLLTQQNAVNGSWQNDPFITALVLKNFPYMALTDTDKDGVPDGVENLLQGKSPYVPDSRWLAGKGNGQGVPGVNAPAVSLTAILNQPISYTLTGSGTFMTTSGSLPAGLSLNGTTGVISGTPTSLGNYPFTYNFTNNTTSIPVTILVVSPQIKMIDGGSPPCNIGCFYPDGKSDPNQVIASIIFVGDVLQWVHAGSSPHTVTASTTQGDYQNHTCPEPGGLSATLNTDQDYYLHQFITAGDCYFRSTQAGDQPNPGTGYPGMQGVVHVLPTIGPSPVWLMPVNITTLPSVSQTLTAIYADPVGYQNLSDTGLTLSGTSRSEALHYNPSTNKFSLTGVSGTCSPGQATTLTDSYLTLNCVSSSASGSGTFLTVTYNLTPQASLSGLAYQLPISAVETGGATGSKTTGYWIVNRPPSAVSVSPTTSTTPVGTVQTFTAVYSDPDGYQNIAAANFYLAGNGGTHNEWLHYLPTANLFTMDGTSAVCSPGQAKTITTSFLTLNCSTSTKSGSGTTLTIKFKVTPLAPSSGIQYSIFSSASDQAGAANAIYAGTWQIP